MGNISSGMESICADIANSHTERNKFLKDLQKDVKSLRDDARKFVAGSKRLHQEMAKSLKAGLFKAREDLAKDVGSLRKDFQKSQKAVRQDLEGASRAWKEMHKGKSEKK